MNCEDPKGFLGYRSTRQAGWFCLSGRRSAGKTFRVSDGGGQCVAGVAVKGGEELSALMASVLDRAFKGEL